MPVATLGAVMLVGWVAGCRSPAPPAHGAVVVACDEDGAAHRAGLQPDDIVTGWRRGTAGGTVESPFTLAMVEQEQALLGPVELTVWRGGRELRRAMPPGWWLLEARPQLAPAALARHRVALERAAAGELDRALAEWGELARLAAARDDALTAAWWHQVLAVELARHDRGDDSRAELAAGAALVAEPRQRAAVWEQGGEALVRASQLPLAAEALRRAAQLHEELAPASPALAFCLVQLARANFRGGGEPARRAVALYRDLAGEGVETALAVNVLATCAYLQCDYDGAAAGYDEALAIARRAGADRSLVRKIVGNQGLVALKREDYSGARELLLAALELAGASAAASCDAGFTANSLGLVAKNTGRYEEARQWYLRALEVFESCRPGGVEVAGTLTNLGNVAMRTGDPRTARHFHQRALALREVLRPGGADVASSLNNLGAVARSDGLDTLARETLERALEIKQRLAPGTLWTANTLTELGELDRHEGRLTAARQRHRAALEIRDRVLPGSSEVAESLACLGWLAYDDGDPEQAERLLRRSVALIEDRIDSDWLSAEARSRFGGRFFEIYRSLALILIEAGRTAEAFELVERARAGALRETVVRRVEIPSGVPREVWLAALRNERAIERLNQRLTRIDPQREASALSAARTELNDLMAQGDRMRADIALLAPGLSEVGAAPPALDVAAIRAALDPGTLLVSYLVGDDRAAVFTLGAAADGGGPLTAVVVPVTSAELSRRVAGLRAFIDRGPSAAEVDSALVAQSRRLYDLLIGPVEEQIAAARRLLIVADGSLVDLPFAVLLPPEASAVPLGCTKPLFFDPSAGVFVELRRSRQGGSPGGGRIVAFGGADYPPSAPMIAQLGLASLAGSRREIGDIAELYGDRATVFLGDDATETNLKRLTASPHVLHLALHAVVDPELPLESALLFSRPGTADAGGEDGILRAWEVIDELHVAADVAVLSSCTSAAGSAVAGEGRIGIARAFQYAGVRSVVMSQWEVADEATADLMAAFYRELGAGRSTADALQVAAAEIAGDWAGGSRRHPFYWAAFQLSGDWL